MKFRRWYGVSSCRPQTRNPWPATRCLDAISDFLLSARRIEGFIQALISWGQEQLRASKSTIFDEAFPFLETRQLQASRLCADQRAAGDLGNDVGTESDGHLATKGTGESTNTSWSSSPAACMTNPVPHFTGEENPSALGSGERCRTGASRGHQADTQAENSRWGEGKEASIDGSRKRRKLGPLRMDERVFVKKASKAYFICA